jgi:hypothetical protein
MDGDVTPDFDTPYSIVKRLNSNFGLDMVVILGGEPSIFREQTHELLSKVHELGLATRLETNASWAKDPQSALDFLRPVKASETSVMLSVDAFHSKYIPYTNNANAIKACIELDIPFILEIPYLDINRKTHLLDVKTLDIEAKTVSGFDAEMKTYRGNIIFTGRAAEKFGDEMAVGKGIPREACTNVPWWGESDIKTTNLLIYEYGGWITKGCGIAIGNVYKQDIAEMVRHYNAEANPVFSMLLNEGPYALAKEAEKYGYVIKRDYADKCHLCHEARQVLKKVYPDILQPDTHYPFMGRISPFGRRKDTSVYQSK